MSGNYPNLYQRARKESPYTQEQAAELLHVSETTVKAWEQGPRTPDNGTVARMVELYGTPWLALEHLKNTSGVLGVLPEGITVQSLPAAAITLINCVLDFADLHRDRQLLRIAEDGVISDEERPVFDGIVHDLDGIIRAALQVKYIREPGTKKDRPDAGTSERLVQRPKPKNDRKHILAHRSENVNTFSRMGGAAL